MRKIRTGVIGCGKVGHYHAKAFQNLPEAEFVAACGRNPERTKAFADQYGVRAFTDIGTMARESGVEAVMVCTPHPSHAVAAVAAAKAGLHLMVEKPLAASLGDADAILGAARENNVLLSVICQRRFYAPCLRMKKAIDEGKVGRPVLGTVNMLGWRDEAYYKSDPWRGSWKLEGGGVLVNQAPHQLDLLLWYMGEIEELYGCWGNMNHPYIEVDDTALAVIRFKSGALGNVVVSNSQNPGLFGQVRVHGENGASIGVQTDGGAMFIAGMSTITEPPFNDVWTVRGEEEMLEKWKREDTEFFNSIDPIPHYYERQIEDFLRAVASGGKPLITGEDGRRAVELFTAIYRSNRDKKPVAFPLEPERGTDFDGRLPA